MPRRRQLQDRPSAPVMTRAEVRPDLTVEFEWTPPASDGGKPLKKYMLWLKGPSGDASLTDIDPSRTSATASNFPPNVQYEVGVIAQNVDGGSVMSNLLYFTVKDEPAAPRLNSAVSDKDGIVLRWGNVVTGSLVRMQAVTRLDGSEDVYRITDLPTYGASGKVLGLAVGETYSLSVIATYLSGKSPESNRLTVAHTPDPAPTPLNTPVITAVHPQDGSAVVEWESSDSRVVKQIVDVESPTRHFGSFEVGKDDRAFTVEGLQNTVQYKVTVTVFSDVDSSTSSARYVTPARPVVRPDTPEWVSLTSDDVAVVVAKWAAPAQIVSSYTLRYKNLRTGIERTVPSITGTTYTVRALEQDCDYTFTVQAVNSGGSSPLGANPKDVHVKGEQPQPVKPAKPFITSASATSDGAVISWKPGAPQPHEAAISGWKLRWQERGESVWEERALEASTLTYTITQLPPETTCDVCVIAVNTVGETASDISTFVVPHHDSPVVTIDSTVTPGVITLNWDITPSETPVDKWVLTSYKDGEDPYEVDIDKTERSVTETDVEDAVTFAVDIAAVVGAKQYRSPRITITTIPYPLPAVTLTGSTDVGKVHLEWGVSDHAPNGWVLQSRVKGTADWAEEKFDTKVTSYDRDDIVTADTMEYRVVAEWYSRQAQSPVVELTLKPKPTPPADPKWLTLTLTKDGYADCVWTSGEGGADSYSLIVTEKETGTAWPAITNITETVYLYKEKAFTLGNTYQFFLTAINAVGHSNTVQKDLYVPAPKDPSKPSATYNPESDTSFSAVITQGNDHPDADPITGMQLAYREQGTSNWTNVDATDEFTKATVTGLKPATVYEARPIALNKFGSRYGDIGTCRTNDVLPARPDLYAMQSTSEFINTQFKLGSGSTVATANLRVDWRVSGTETWSSSPLLVPTATDYRISNLTPGTEYEVRAVAIAATKTEAYSDSKKISTIKADETPSDQQLEITSTTEQFVYATVTDKGNHKYAKPTYGLMAFWRKKGTTEWLNKDVFGSLSQGVAKIYLTVGSNTTDTTYEVKVVATNAAGKTESPIVEATTPAFNPAAPVITSVTPLNELDAEIKFTLGGK